MARPQTVSDVLARKTEAQLLSLHRSIEKRITGLGYELRVVEWALEKKRKRRRAAA